MTPSWFLILESFFNRSEKKAALLFTCSYSVCGIKSRQLLRNDVFAESFIYRIKAAWKSLVTSTENCSRCHCFMFTFHDSAWRHLKERRRINCTQQKLFFLSRWRGRPPPASFGRASVDLSHHKLCAAAAHQLSQQLQTTHTELADLSLHQVPFRVISAAVFTHLFKFSVILHHYSFFSEMKWFKGAICKKLKMPLKI